MSLGWEHYATHKFGFHSVLWSNRPEPNILLFRRPLGTDGKTGLVNEEMARIQKEQFRKQYGLDWFHVCSW